MGSTKTDAENTLDFSFESACRSDRKVYRAAVQGISAALEDPPLAVQVRDVSTFGVSFAAQTHAFHVGQRVRVSLYIGNRLFLRSLDAHIVRLIENGYVACEFIDLSRRQEFAMDKLVLEVQKRLILLHRKAQQESDRE